MSKAEEKHAKYLRPDESHKKGCVLRCTNKGHNHRENGYSYAVVNYKSYYNIDFINSAANKERLDVAYPPPLLFRRQSGWDPRHIADTWFIGGRKPSNWKKGHHPFTNQAHHILPVGALHDSFDIWELKLLQNSGYNINAGINIMILPTEERMGKVMLMLIHPTNHTDYSTSVKRVIAEITGKFTEGKSDPDDHSPVDDKNIPKLKDDIELWSRDQAAELILQGVLTPGVQVNVANVFSII